MSPAVSIWISLAIIGIILLIAYWKTGHFIKCMLFSAFTGTAALGVIWLAGRFFASAVDITPLSIAASVLLGVPGVITMLILNLI